jgi:hypothetical protein
MFNFIKYVNNNKTKSKAYEVYTEFGPKLRIERFKRLNDKFKGIEKDKLIEWIEEFNKIDKEIYDFIASDKNKTKNELIKILNSKYNFMNNKAIKRAIFLTWYYSWKDGIKFKRK